MRSDTRKVLHDELEKRSATLLDRIIARMRAEMSAYAHFDHAILASTAEPTLQRLLEAVGQHRALTPDELRTLTELGELRGRQGIALPDMFAAWRIGVRTVTDDMIAIGRAAGIAESELLDLTTEVLDTTDLAIHTLAHGHHNVEHELTRQDQQRRTDLVRGILFGTLGPAEIRFRAEQYGLDPSRIYRAVRARPTATSTMSTLERAIGSSVGTTAPHGMVAQIDGDLAGFLTEPPLENLGATIGYGPAAELNQMESSFQRATRAMTTAAAFHLTGTFDLAALGLLPAVLADSEIGDELVARYLVPLGAGDSADAIRETVECYLATDMRADLTAQAMHLHTNTVRYRLRRFEELAGADLHNPNHLLETWWAIQRTRLDTSVHPA
ncbi:PucR family transcriptional regulator [Nocardia sp. GAS34]|uniref:PucR family transcriptional regulator n=1 Tax=unclassified Nocardia TaxID=2637762 RepID=UPI003D257631